MNTIKQSELKDKAREALATLQADLAAGKSEGLQAYLSFSGRFHHYSVGNQILIWYQCPKASYVAGFKKWQSEFGRYVKKGEHGIMIRVPMFKKAATPDDDPDVFFGTGYVFDLAQTDGQPFEVPNLRLIGEVEASYTQGIEAAIRAAGLELVDEDMATNKHGYFDRANNKIAISTANLGAARLKTLAHEYAHSLLHSDGSENAQKTIKEMEAESAAFIVCAHFGINSLRASGDYLQLYDPDLKAFTERMERIVQTAIKIITETEKHLPERIKVAA